MEYFSLLGTKKLKKVINAGVNELTHIIFADNILIFVKANISGAEAIRDVFSKMHNSTWLQLNYEKFTVFLGEGVSCVEEIVQTLNIKQGCLSVRYVGMLLSSVNLRDKDYVSLIDKIKQCIEGWEAKLLSIASRLELIKGVIYRLISYWMQCFCIPSRTIGKNQKCHI